MVVATGREYLHNAVPDLDQRNIKGTAAQIVHHDSLGFAIVQAISQSRGGRLIDDAAHFQPGNSAGILGGLALGVIKIGRHRNDGFGHGFAKVGFGIRLELLQNLRADLLRGIAPAVNRNTLI